MNLFSKFAFVILALALTSPAEASPWREFWVNQGHAYMNTGVPFKARVSFTAERIVPTYGLEGGADYAGKLFIELFTLERQGQCPRVAISQKSADGSELIYLVALNYDGRAQKCWGEVSLPNNPGRIAPRSLATTYFQQPIRLKVGSAKMSHRLYVQEASSYREFDFKLGDAL
ncbi:MAG TPA: hypothetical protein VFV50_07725 [Bdellovibrionales bacterium]|nr:hypothetical protein [Bdellovibrionales bacterium]